MKRCFKCNITKPIDDFYIHSQMMDGHLNKCKDCTKKDVHQNYYSNFDYYQKYEKRRNKVSKRKQSKLKYQTKYRIINTMKYKAHVKVSNAIRDSKLEKHPCEICGNPNAEAHHHDYSKPLDVKWLCIYHHGRGSRHNY